MAGVAAKAPSTRDPHTAGGHSRSQSGSSNIVFDAGTDTDTDPGPSTPRGTRHEDRNEDEEADLEEEASATYRAHSQGSRSASAWTSRLPFARLAGPSQYAPLSNGQRSGDGSTAALSGLARTANALVAPCCSVAIAIVFALSIIMPAHKPDLAPAPIYSIPHLTSASIGPALPRDVQEDLTLSSASCQAHFPLFYPQLQANEAAWKARAGLRGTKVQEAWQQCEGGCAHIIISEGEVYIRKLTHDWQSRVRAVLSLFQTAVASATHEDRVAMEGAELVFSTADKDGTKGDDGAGWVLDKKVGDAPGQYLLPDFSFAAWPEAGVATYAEFRRDAEVINQKLSWSQKKNKAFWRGDPKTGSPYRQGLWKQISEPGAEAWADVKRTSFWEEGAAPIVLPADHCEHKYLLHSEGNSYSGRSKFVLGCKSAVIMHKPEWTQHFHPALVSANASEDRNVIEMDKGYFDGLGDLVRSLQASDAQVAATAAASISSSSSSPSIGQRIAINADRTLTQRYLTPAATACYIRAALASYRSVLDQEWWPTPLTAVKPGPQLVPGGGVRPGAGAGEFKGEQGLKKLGGLKGDIALTTWQLLGQPAWPLS